MTPRIRLAAGVALILFGFALLGWAIYAGLNPTAPFDTRLASITPDAAKEVAAFGLKADRLQKIEVSAKDERKPVAEGVVASADGGRLTPGAPGRPPLRLTSSRALSTPCSSPTRRERAKL